MDEDQVTDAPEETPDGPVVDDEDVTTGEPVETNDGSPDSAAPETPDWGTTISGLGDDFADITPDKFVERYQQERQEIEQLRQAREQQQAQLQSLTQLAQYGNEYLQYRQNPRFQQVLEQLNQPEPEPEPLWNPPKVDERRAAQYRRQNPETGQEEWAPETPPDLRAAFEERKAYHADFARRFVESPGETIAPFVDQRARELVEDMLNEREQRQSVDQLARELLVNTPWIGQMTPNGVQLTPEGQSHLSHMKSLRETILNGSPAEQTRLLLRLTAADRAMQYQISQPNPATPDQRRQEQTNRSRPGANAKPSRSGAQPLPEVPGDDHNTYRGFAEEVFADLRARGAA